MEGKNLVQNSAQKSYRPAGIFFDHQKHGNTAKKKTGPDCCND
jgi:hypothetical protein